MKTIEVEYQDGVVYIYNHQTGSMVTQRLSDRLTTEQLIKVLNELIKHSDKL